MDVAASLLEQISQGHYPEDSEVWPGLLPENPQAHRLAQAIRSVVNRQKQLEAETLARAQQKGSSTNSSTPSQDVPPSPSISQVTFTDGSTRLVSSMGSFVASDTADAIGLQSQVQLLKEQFAESERVRVSEAAEKGARIASLEAELAKSRQDIEDFLEALRKIGEVTKAVSKGDLSQKILIQAKGVEILELKSHINEMVDRLKFFAAQVTRVAREVGTEGRLGGQAELKDVEGIWAELTNSVNHMAANLVCLSVEEHALTIDNPSTLDRRSHDSRRTR